MCYTEVAEFQQLIGLLYYTITLYKVLILKGYFLIIASSSSNLWFIIAS